MCAFILKGGEEDRVAAALNVWSSALHWFLLPEAFPRLEEQVSHVLMVSSTFFKFWHKNWV